MKKILGQGFTLLEIVLAISVLGGIVFGSVVLFGAIISTRAKLVAAQEVNGNARLALQLMSGRIRAASSINSASSTFALHPGILSLATTSGGTNPTVFRVSDDGVRLEIVEGLSNPVFLTSNRVKVNNLLFTSVPYPGSLAGVQIDFTLAYQGAANDPYYTFSKSFQTTVFLRP